MLRQQKALVYFTLFLKVWFGLSKYKLLISAFIPFWCILPIDIHSKCIIYTYYCASN